jgi:nitrate reductase NapE
LIQINTGDFRPRSDAKTPWSATAVGLRLQHSDLYMTDHSNKVEPVRSSARTPRDELIVFLIIVALVWPVMTVGVVGGYGFAVWMYQVVAGPPGPPRR